MIDINSRELLVAQVAKIFIASTELSTLTALTESHNCAYSELVYLMTYILMCKCR